MISMGKITCPEKTILTDKGNNASERAFIRIARHPALALEIEARLLCERHALPNRRFVHCIHAIQPIADPTATDLKNNDLQLWELIKDAILKERSETFPDDVAERDILKEGRVTPSHVAKSGWCCPMRFKRRMETKR